MRRIKTRESRHSMPRRGGVDPSPTTSKHAVELMELAVEAAQSRHLPDFLEQFALRATRMLDAMWGGVAVYRGRETELHAMRGGASTAEAAANWIISRAQESQNDVETRAIPKETSEELALPEKPGAVVFVRIAASDNERLGTLCLLRKRKTLGEGEKRLLHALASHAALSLENFRRFSQLERSKRQWVEDIDAISDYIVVHDRAWNIVRTNRSLASHLGVPPVALVGEAMSSLRQIAETGSDLPCPFCRDTDRAKEECVAASAERIFLVSTSRTPGAADDDTRTIHVLKDITDRREAERRYRELFDSIQEGLFFATPDGRFLDVNDAMVRMLGYASREELLRADVSPHLYPVPEAREKFLRALSERGVLRNYEETLRRKDGTLLHTLQNITAVRDARGRIAQIRGLMLDVTEQKTFQSQLQRERDFNQKILNTTQSMILVLDTAGLISYANRRCYETGYQEGELIGHRLVDWVEASHREDFDAALETTAHGHQVENLELRVRRSDGSMGHFSISLSPMRDEQNAANSVVQVNSVLRQTIKLRSYDFASHGVEVVEDFEEALAAALGDSQQLQQVFLNILNNAYDAVQEAGQRGRIKIHTRRQAEMIEVAISDNGTGISDPQRIFDPFYTTKQVGKGTGLGLSICYGIVRAHGGEIQCWNNEQVAGSTFVVRIPVATEAALAAAATKEARR